MQLIFRITLDNLWMTLDSEEDYQSLHQDLDRLENGRWNLMQTSVKYGTLGGSTKIQETTGIRVTQKARGAQQNRQHLCRVLLKTLTWSYTLTVVHCGNRTCSRGFTNDRYLARQGRDLKALLTFGGPRFCVSGDRGGLEVSVWAGGWCVVGDGRSKAVCPGTQVLWARSSEKATQQTFNIVNQRVGCYVFPLTEKRRHLFHPY
ncbi:uncharacterized protein [Mobula birostris]|uniref:uncharacterized protein isoform X1 n=1 Tax=Mobula birostris TaxID=1983395 RepID=UPI003B27B88B